MDRDARDFDLSGRPSRLSAEHETRRQAVADHYYAAFSAYPDVLTDIQHEGFLTRTTAHTVEGRIDREAMLIREGKRQLVIYITGMARRGKLGQDLTEGAHGDEHCDQP